MPAVPVWAGTARLLTLRSRCSPHHRGLIRLRISDGKFVNHTTEMILWSMILTFLPFSLVTVQTTMLQHFVEIWSLWRMKLYHMWSSFWWSKHPMQVFHEIKSLWWNHVTSLFRSSLTSSVGVKNYLRQRAFLPGDSFSGSCEWLE